MKQVKMRFISVIIALTFCFGTPTGQALSILNLDMTGSALFQGTGSSVWFNGYTETGFGLVALQFSGSLDPSVQTLFFTGTAYDGTPVNISGATFATLNTNIKKTANHFATINTGKYYKAGNYMLEAHDASGTVLESIEITADRSLLIPTEIITLDTNRNGKIDALRVIYAWESLLATTSLTNSGIYLISRTGGIASRAIDYESPWTQASVEGSGVFLQFPEYDIIRTNLTYSPDTQSDLRLKWAMDTGVKHQYGLALAAYDTYPLTLRHGSQTGGLILDGGTASGQTLSFESINLNQDLIVSGSVLSGSVMEPIIKTNGNTLRLLNSTMTLSSLRIGSGSIIFDSASRIIASECLHSELGTGGSATALSGNIVCQTYTGSVIQRPITVPGTSVFIEAEKKTALGKKNGTETLVCPQVPTTGTQTTIFTDMLGKQWIETLEHKGIVEGYQREGAKTFEPNAYITLHQAIKMVEALEKPIRFGQDTEWEHKLETAHPQRFQRAQAKNIGVADARKLLAEYPDALNCLEDSGKTVLTREDFAKIIWTVGAAYNLFAQ